MTRKHFEAAAELIRNMRSTAANIRSDLNAGAAARDLELRAQGAEDVFVSVASDADPRFDSVRFRQACRL